MRFCFPSWIGPRHAGLGNELIPWAKAFIASQELNLKLLHPAWGLNDRQYYEDFGTSRFDWVGYYALKTLLPCFAFSEADYVATGERDYDRAIVSYAKRMGLHKRRSYILLTDGMWGGYYAVRKAKPFIIRELCKARFALKNLYELEKRTAGKRLRIAVHIRRGDFAAPVNSKGYQGLWNTRVPLNWYSNVCTELRNKLGESACFVLVTDGTSEELSEFIAEFEPVTSFDQEHRACSELLFMAGADALVCSISSFSMWAAFLSGAPYFWYFPHLQESNGFLTMWGDPISVRTESDVLPRGVPVAEDGRIPTRVIEYLKCKARLNDVRTDLVQSGGVPAGSFSDVLH